jgi:hypothetical protein
VDVGFGVADGDLVGSAADLVGAGSLGAGLALAELAGLGLVVGVVEGVAGGPDVGSAALPSRSPTASPMPSMTPPIPPLPSTVGVLVALADGDALGGRCWAGAALGFVPATLGNPARDEALAPGAGLALALADGFVTGQGDG